MDEFYFVFRRSCSSLLNQANRTRALYTYRNLHLRMFTNAFEHIIFELGHITLLMGLALLNWIVLPRTGTLRPYVTGDRSLLLFNELRRRQLCLRSKKGFLVSPLSGARPLASLLSVQCQGKTHPG